MKSAKGLRRSMSPPPAAMLFPIRLRVLRKTNPDCVPDNADVVGPAGRRGRSRGTVRQRLVRPSTIKPYKLGAVCVENVRGHVACLPVRREHHDDESSGLYILNMMRQMLEL